MKSILLSLLLPCMALGLTAPAPSQRPKSADSATDDNDDPVTPPETPAVPAAEEQSFASKILANIKSKSALHATNGTLEKTVSSLQAENAQLKADQDVLAKEAAQVEVLQARLQKLDSLLGLPPGTCETSPEASLAASFSKKVSSALIDVAATAGVDATTLPKATSADTDPAKAKTAGLQGLECAQATIRTWFN